MNYPSRLRLTAALLLLVLHLPVGAQSEPAVLIVDLYLNQQYMGDTFVLQDGNGLFHIEEDILRRWQVRKPWPAPLMLRGSRYYAIADLAGATASFVARRMELQVFLPAALMPLRTVGLGNKVRKAHVEDVGAYLDYELSWLNQTASASHSRYALLRPVVFGPSGNVSANLSYLDRSGGQDFGNERGLGLKVLSLTYTRDDPEKLRTLQAGDIVTTPGLQGRSLRIGGIQLGTNFATQPTFVTYPLPSFYGETAVPSALDIYVNGRLRRTEQVQPGQYVLEDIPVVNGAGQMQVITRDALGRQQVYSQDFYVSSELLRAGLSDYSVSLGALREDYALENFRYGDIAGSAAYRYGLRDDLTIEGHGEFSTDVATLGGGAQYAIKQGGTLRGGLGLSTGTAGFGSRWQLGFRQINRVLNYSLEVSGSSRNFDMVGNYSETPRLQVLASAGKSFHGFGSVGMSLVRQDFHESAQRTLVSANHSKTFRNFLSLSTFVSYARTQDDSVSIGIRFSMPFGERHHAYGGLSLNDSSPVIEAVVRRNMPVGSGYGYHVGVGAADRDFLDAGVSAQSEFGTYTLDVRANEGSGSLWQASTHGSVAYLSGMTRFSRRIRDAFAVVNVGGVEGVRVYAENQEIGRTDENGRLFVPGLQPYYKNQLRIEIDDLPLNASVGSANADTVPYYRSGVLVNFDVSVSNNVLFRAVLADGSPVPEGARVRIRYPDGTFPVGRDGKVYIEGIDRSSLVEIVWNNNVCRLDLPFAVGPEIIHKLGDIVCDPSQVH